MSQRALAAAGVTHTTLVRLEAGKPAHPSTVRKLARALDVDPQELLDMAAAGRLATGAQQTAMLPLAEEAEATASPPV